MSLEFPYFNQTNDWATFWESANPSTPHTTYFFENEFVGCYVYQYPLAGGVFSKLKFWYIPRAFIIKKQLDSSDLSVQTNNLLDIIKAKAATQNIVLIKLDLGLDFQQWPDTRSDLTNSAKKLQYLSTNILNLNNLESCISIEDFWTKNKSWFEASFDKRTRYGTRKALDYGWKFSTEKSSDNFEKFYKLHFDTANRQGFGLHSYDYLAAFYKQNFSRVIILRDADNVVQAGWLGAAINYSLINLYGGNSLVSRDNYGQYFLHLIALWQAVNQELSTYDLGGMELGKGFDLFKQGYKGSKVEFLGPFDIILKPRLHNLYLLTKSLKDKFSKR